MFSKPSHQQQRALSISKHRKEFEKIFLANQVTLVVAETGSGKTTQIPKFVDKILISQGRTGTIICTQPRRLAVFNVSRRVSEEMGVDLGTYVGYGIRFEDCSGPETKIKFVTDSLLLRYVMSNVDFSGYDCVIIDEVHERTCSTDVLLGLMSLALPKRKDLKVVLMSATMDVEPFMKFFKNAALFKVPGRSYPVTIEYLAVSVDDYLLTAVEKVLQIHENQPSGDILVFLTGKAEIELACRMTDEAAKSKPLKVYEMYSNMPEGKLLQVFEPCRSRKVIFSTNIAETSLTIEGVVYVVDSGFFKQKIYHPHIHVESLLVTPISKANAIQRAGRAGRMCAGWAYRLYTKESYEGLIPETHPEIIRSALESVLLTLKMCNVSDLVRFPFPSAPAPETLIYALESLYHLGIMNEEGDLTVLGQQVSRFPLDPAQAVSIIASWENGCAAEIIKIVSILSSPNVFTYPGRKRQRDFDLCKNKFLNITSDHLTLLSVFDNFVSCGRDLEWCNRNFLEHRSLEIAERISRQLLGIMKSLNLPQNSRETDPIKLEQSVIRSLIRGFFLNTVFLNENQRYLTLRDLQPVSIHPGSSIKGYYDFLIYDKAIINPESWIITVTITSLNLLMQVAPRYFTASKFCSFVKKKISQIKLANQ